VAIRGAKTVSPQRLKDSKSGTKVNIAVDGQITAEVACIPRGAAIRSQEQSEGVVPAIIHQPHPSGAAIRSWDYQPVSPRRSHTKLGLSTCFPAAQPYEARSNAKA
jgi:antitoxin (DNA-binding transcriptional repressor) of toxin-antitoxin stability system